MKLMEYEGIKIVTVEMIDAYITKPEFRNRIKEKVPKYIGLDNFTHVPMVIARNYDQKTDFNYSRGLNLYPVDKVISMFDTYADYFNDKINIKAFKSDVRQGKIRSLDERAVIKKAPVLQPVKKAVINSEPEIQNVNLNQGMPFDEVYAFADKMMERQVDILTTIIKDNELLRTDVRDLMIKVEELTKKLEAIETRPAEPEVQNVIVNEPSIFDTPIILKEDSSYEEWMKGINRACELITKENPSKKKSDILHEAYDRIRKQYGIVWEQEAKEFKTEFGRGPVNTRELCWWMETHKKNCKNLLIGKLNTIYGEEKRNKEKRKAV